MPDTAASRHELNGTTGQGFTCSHGIGVGQGAGDDVRANFSIRMAVGRKTTGGLDQVIVEHAEDAKVGVGRIVVLGERKMKPRF